MMGAPVAEEVTAASSVGHWNFRSARVDQVSRGNTGGCGQSETYWNNDSNWDKVSGQR